jgi:hypothetical protein
VSLADHAHGRGHAGAQPPVAVVDAQDGVVGHHVLLHVRLRADLEDLRLEDLAGIRVDRERRLLRLVQLADVRLVDRGVHLHARQILGDGEQHRRLQRCRHGLPDVDRPLQDRPGDRRADGGVVEVEARHPHRGARLRHLRLGGGLVRDRRVVLGDRRVDVRLADDAALGQLARAVELRLRLPLVDLRAQARGLTRLQRRLGLGHVGPEPRRVDLGYHLPFLDLAVEVGAQLRDRARHLGADLHRHHGVERSGGRHRGLDGAAIDARRPERRRRARPRGPPCPQPSADRQRGYHDACQGPTGASGHQRCNLAERR